MSRAPLAIIPSLLIGLACMLICGGCCEDCQHPMEPETPEPEITEWVLYDDVVVSSQDELDALVGVKTILGNLEIGEWAEADLEPLSTLEMVESLSISNSSLVDLQDLIGLKYIGYTLSITGCSRLESLAGLDSLVSSCRITIQSNPLLSSLSALSRVHNIEEMTLADLGDVESLDLFDDLERLRRLVISGCSQVIELPSVPMPDLEMLTLTSLNSLPNIYCGSGELPKLDRLILNDLPAFEAPATTTFSRLEWLEVTRLPLEACTQLVHGIPTLYYLQISGIPDMMNLTSLAGLPIEGLTLVDLPVTDLQGLTSLSEMNTLRIRNCGALTSLAGLSNDTPLRVLSISQCEQFIDFGHSEGLSGVRSIILTDCGITNLSEGSTFNNCTNLEVYDCNELTTLHGLESFPSLEVLRLHRLPALENFGASVYLPELNQIEMVQCNALIDLSGLSNLPNLGILHVHECTKLLSLNGPSFPSSMSNIRIEGNTNFISLEALDALTFINFMVIMDNPVLGDAYVLEFVQGIETYHYCIFSGNGP